MSFDVLRVKVGRRPLTVVELDLDFCDNVYGITPCTAAIGVTGTQECYNTYASCQDTANYVKILKTYKFTSQSSFLPIGETIFPCITSVDFAPVQIDPKGFSVSGSVTIELQDFPHHDRDIDPYCQNRGYNPETRGTFFGKLRGRNKYLENRVIRVKEGYIDANRTIYSRTRTYFIDRMEGPDANGRVRLIGKDALRFADASKAKAPKVSKGSLSVDISPTATSLILTPTGIGSEYPDSGTVKVDDEIILYSSKSGDVLNGLVRAAEGTASDEHRAGRKVQLALRYTSAKIPYIIRDLLVNYAELDDAYIPSSDWDIENATWLGSFNSTVLLTEPKGVKELLQEIIESAGCDLWWDDITAKVMFKVRARPLPVALPPVLNDNEHFLAGSVSVKDLPRERVSQVITYFLPNTPAIELKAENFRAVSIQVDTTGEGVNAYGTSNSRTILNRWVTSQPLVEEVGIRLLKRYKTTPRQILFQVDAKDATLKTGELVDISTRLIQGMDGLPSVVRCAVMDSREITNGSHYEYTALQSDDTLGTAVLIAPDSMPNWTSASATQKTNYMFISNNAGLMSDGSPAPLIT